LRGVRHFVDDFTRGAEALLSIEAIPMQKFVVTVTQQIEADTAEEAALLMYQSLTREPAPLFYSVTNEANTSLEVILDRTQADEFAATDHTADPGNW
jgi:hypothetical protein